MQPHPLSPSLNGYVVVSNGGPDNFAIGAFSPSAARCRQYASDGEAVVDIRRARALARDVHGWEIPPADAVDR